MLVLLAHFFIVALLPYCLIGYNDYWSIFTPFSTLEWHWICLNSVEMAKFGLGIMARQAANVLSVSLHVVESAARTKLVSGLQFQREDSSQPDSASVYYTGIASSGPGNITMGRRRSGKDGELYLTTGFQQSQV